MSAVFRMASLYKDGFQCSQALDLFDSALCQLCITLSQFCLLSLSRTYADSSRSDDSGLHCNGKTEPPAENCCPLEYCKLPVICSRSYTSSKYPGHNEMNVECKNCHTKRMCSLLTSLSMPERPSQNTHCDACRDTDSLCTHKIGTRSVVIGAALAALSQC